LPGIAGTGLTAYLGQIPFTNPAAGQNTYLARFSANVQVSGTLFLCDRLWHNSGIGVTTTTPQTINSVTFPARDVSGSTSGNNVFIGAEVTTVMGGPTPVWTITYTNSAGVQSRSAVTATLAASMAAGSFIPLPMQSGDTGVMNVQTFQISITHTSGAFALVGYRIIARVDITTNNLGNAIDFISSGMPRLYDNTVPFFLWLPGTVTAPTITAQIIYTQG
jgi:hypothetical protein